MSDVDGSTGGHGFMALHGQPHRTEAGRAITHEVSTCRKLELFRLQLLENVHAYLLRVASRLRMSEEMTVKAAPSAVLAMPFICAGSCL